MIVLDRNGKFLRSSARAMSVRPHGIQILPDRDDVPAPMTVTTPFGTARRKAKY